MVLVIDNYDSFTYNLVQYLGELGAEVKVRRNDQTSIDELDMMRPDHILISPGPGRPEDAGITLDVIRRFGRTVPLMGVCLGHQALGLAFGGQVVRAPVPMHGKTSTVEHDSTGLFAGITTSFQATRYHSLVVAEEGWPADETCARSKDDGLVMALRHRQLPLHGVQFHPESILTNEGRRLLRNFIEMA